MCGRYDLSDIDSIADYFDVDMGGIELRPNHNVRPTHTMPVIVFDEAAKRKRLKMMRWGMRPQWAKKDLINAQAEKISTSKFWKPMQHCLVIANRFYEWHPQTRKPVAFGVTDRPLITFAGLYTTERLADGTEQERYVVVTTSPNSTVAQVHDRMALILQPQHEELYVSEHNKEDLLYTIAKPYDDSLMTAQEVALL